MTSQRRRFAVPRKAAMVTPIEAGIIGSILTIFLLMVGIALYWYWFVLD
jgi:hypothetical protein